MIDVNIADGYWLVCDICGQEHDFETFDDALDYKKRKRLDKRKIQG